MREQVMERRRYLTPDGIEIRIDVLECGHVIDASARRDHQMFRVCKQCPPSAASKRKKARLERERGVQP